MPTRGALVAARGAGDGAPVLRRATVTAVVALLPAYAGAQTDPDIERGIALRERGDDAGALAAFTAAWTRAPTAQARAQMGLAALALGRWVDADAWLREALARAEDPWVSARRAVLLRARDDVAAHLGALDVLANVPDAEVLVDGAPVGRTPLPAPLRVPAGAVVVEVRAPGHHPAQRRAVIVAGQLARESVTLVPRLADAPPPLAGPQRPPRPLDLARLHQRATGPWRATSLAAFVTGGAALGAGLLFTAMHASERGDFDAAGCRLDAGIATGGAGCAEVNRRADAWFGLSVAGFTAGGAMLLTGVALRALMPPRPHALGSLSCGASPTAVACAVRF